MASTPTRVDAPLLDANGNRVTWAVEQDTWRRLARMGEHATPPVLPADPPPLDQGTPAGQTPVAETSSYVTGRRA